MNLCVSIAFNPLRGYKKHISSVTHEKICAAAFIKEIVINFNRQYNYLSDTYRH